MDDPKNEYAIFNGVTQQLECSYCHEVLKVEFPMPLNMFTYLLTGFAEHHKHDNEE